MECGEKGRGVRLGRGTNSAVRGWDIYGQIKPKYPPAVRAGVFGGADAEKLNGHNGAPVVYKPMEPTHRFNRNINIQVLLRSAAEPAKNVVAVELGIGLSITRN